MPKRIKKVPEFGRWIKQARLQQKKKQQELAESAGLTQQYWSKIELQGLVPSEDELARICRVLGKSMHEAHKIIGASTKIDELERRLTEEFEAFIGWLKSLHEPVHIYVVREDAEQVDEDSIELHFRILDAQPNFKISILFRYSDPSVWRSFRQLPKSVEKRWIEESRTTNNPRDRISGYFRKPNFDEKIAVKMNFNEANEFKDMPLPLPLPQPVVIVVAKGLPPHLFTYGHHPQIVINPTEGYLMPHRNIVFSVAPEPKARLFLSWIDPEGLGGSPSEELWEKIRLD